MLKSCALAVVLVGGLSTVAVAQPPTCTFPWGDGWNPAATFEVGAFYRSPYSEVIEVLGQTCRIWDFDAEGRRVCGYWTLAVRNIQGRAIKGPVSKTLVYVHPTAGVLYYADGDIPAETPLDNGKWGKLPEGCYPRTVVVQAGPALGSLTVRK